MTFIKIHLKFLCFTTPFFCENGAKIIAKSLSMVYNYNTNDYVRL